MVKVQSSNMNISRGDTGLSSKAQKNFIYFFIFFFNQLLAVNKTVPRDIQKGDGKPVRDLVMAVLWCKSRQVMWAEKEGTGGRACLAWVTHLLGSLPPIHWRPLIPSFDPWLLEWTESHKYRRPEQQVRMHKLWPRPPSPPSSPPPAFLAPPADARRLASRSSSSSSFPSVFQLSACDATLLPCRCHSAWQN